MASIRKLRQELTRIASVVLDQTYEGTTVDIEVRSAPVDGPRTGYPQRGTMRDLADG